MLFVVILKCKKYVESEPNACFRRRRTKMSEVKSEAVRSSYFTNTAAVVSLMDKANSNLETMKIHDKDYVPVVERVKAFRRVYPTGSVMVDILEHDPQAGYVLMKATVGYTEVDGTFVELAHGHAIEKRDKSQINRDNYIENCETSCVGRAMANAGFGLKGDIASANEMLNVEKAKRDSYATKEQKEYITRVLSSGLLEKFLAKQEIKSIDELSYAVAESEIERLSKKIADKAKASEAA